MPRSALWTLAAFGVIYIGWGSTYLAVRVAGTLRAGERFELIPGPREVGITELFRSRVAGRQR